MSQPYLHEVFVSMRVELVNPTHEESGTAVSKFELTQLCGDVSQYSSARDAFETALSEASIEYDGFSFVVPEDQSAWVLVINHRHGTDVSVHWLKEGAEAILANWVQTYWEEDGPKGDMPDDPDEAIKAYFDFADESFDLNHAVVQ